MSTMNHNPMDLDSVASSQTSIELPGLARMDKENASPLFSSPLKYDGVFSFKPRRPPTVTPKRFSRFFSPRDSSRTRPEQQTNAARKLRDITRNSVNSALQQPETRPTKRRKRIIDLPESIPLSSPIKQSSASPSKLLTIYEDGLDLPETSDEEPDAEEPLQPLLPVRIRRLAHRTDSQRLLLRGFGDVESSERGQRGYYHSGRPYASSADYYTTPSDQFICNSPRTLPFSAAACNTNSLVAIGEEGGTVHLVDTAKGCDFSRAHISMPIKSNAIMDMAFSPCDYILATGGGDATVRIVDVQTQRTLSVLVGHRASVKQVTFNPQNDKLVTSSARDGVVNIWDLRCSGNASKSLRVGYIPPIPAAAGTIYPYNIMLAGPAHRATSAKSPIEKYRTPNDSLGTPAGVSITAIQHLPESRSHLLLTASEQNSSLKLFDLRVAGRNTKSEKFGYEVPVACTPTLASHRRPFGVSALVLSTDGARVYSACRDSTVWAYSTQHLILGSAPEMVNLAKRTRMTPPDQMKQGLGPLYGFRHPKLRIGSFYIRSAVRKATVDQEELLAVGSQDACPVLFPLDERHFRERSIAADPAAPNDDGDPTSRILFSDQHSAAANPPIYNVGTALVHGHRKEVTSLAFSQAGDLASISDDFTARCWRQDREAACSVRTSNENRWKHGWAEAADSHDDLDSLC